MAKYLPHHHQFEPIEDKTTLLLVAVLLVLLIGLVCLSCFEGMVKTSKASEEYSGTPVTATYDRPAAYRLNSPTPEQMEHYHDLLRVMEVRR
jgi:hypothetical protein